MTAESSLAERRHNYNFRKNPRRPNDYSEARLGSDYSVDVTRIVLEALSITTFDETSSLVNRGVTRKSNDSKAVRTC